MPKVGQKIVPRKVEPDSSPLKLLVEDSIKLKEFARWVRHVTVNAPAVVTPEARKVMEEALITISDLGRKLDQFGT